MSEQFNLQKAKSSKIFGIVKSGANRTDINLIKRMQGQGYNEHEIQREAGVNYITVRSFMKVNNPAFEETPVPASPETQHLHDQIAKLEGQLETQKADAQTEGKTDEKEEVTEEY